MSFVKLMGDKETAYINLEDIKCIVFRKRKVFIYLRPNGYFIATKGTIGLDKVINYVNCRRD